MRIKVQNAYKEYNGTRVLDIESLEIKEGLIYGIMGLNGSGKTTLVECISGINKLTKGLLTYDGENGIGAARNSISIMTQKPYLFDMSVLDNIAIGLKFRKLGKEDISARIEKYLSYFDMKDLLYKNARGLSGGEGAKTALLRTAALETEVMLLDEPTSSMDMESTIKSESLIKEMARNSRTVVVVTHDLYQVKRVADYILFMDKGKIIEMGEKNKILENPENSLVKQILSV